MKKLILLSLAAAAAASLGGCTPQGQNAAGGALVGGATGALVGAAVTGGRPGGTLVGAGLGAVGGAMVGSALTPAPRCAEFYYDYYGNQVCRSYY